MVDKKYVEIFHGKKAARYNKLVLKTLFENGHLSSWDLARKIVENDLERKKKNWYHETQKVQSVLVRKNGRLTDLANKQFVEDTDKGYCLTFNKGFCSALILYEVIPRPAIDDLAKIYELFPEFKEILDIISRLHPEVQFEMYRVMKEIATKLLEKGLNFESISNREFNNFFDAQSQEFVLEDLKKERKNEQKWETSPELMNSIQKFLSRIEELALKQLEEFNSLKNRYTSSQTKKKAESI